MILVILQLVLPNGIGSLPVDVSVMWTGNGINHPIDTLVDQTNSKGHMHAVLSMYSGDEVL